MTRENPWEMMKEGAKPPAVRSRGNNAERQRAEAAQYSRSAFVSLHDDDDRDIAVPLVERYTGEQQEKVSVCVCVRERPPTSNPTENRVSAVRFEFRVSCVTLGDVGKLEIRVPGLRLGLKSDMDVTWP